MKLLENKNMSLVLKSILVVSILVFIVNYYFKSKKIREDFSNKENESDSVVYHFKTDLKGKAGPSQSRLNNYYRGTNLEGKVVSRQGTPREWKVPSCNYKITAVGGGTGSLGFKRAVISGTFKLEKDELIHIVVGQTGKTEHLSIYNQGGGGAGGTFVFQPGAEEPLVVAGGQAGINLIGMGRGRGFPLRIPEKLWQHLLTELLRSNLDREFKQYGGRRSSTRVCQPEIQDRMGRFISDDCKKLLMDATMRIEEVIVI